MEPRGWQATIEHAVKAIVSIRFSQVAAFDTEGAETSEASGYIVDAERGIILTNRHVACSGPFVGEAIAHDHEEVDVHAIYRDPIHDFGFLKFDPSKIRYMPVTAIPLRPDLARVGLDIRVVGNDAGEKLSILAGSISRLDRNAPEYGDMTYNDFNTFYLQAASSTSGGSSGSPVIDIHGNAVALQAGGHTKAATDFFLPLDRVVRALHCIQRGEPVIRGTIQVQFLHRPFDETRRLGLQPETEAMVRREYPDEIGMLVVETVVPEGPGADHLEEGDVLVRINGATVTKFVSLEEAMDAHVGRDLTMEIERGGEPMTVTITVQDLHSITPDRYVEIGGATLNEVSYQLARSYCVPTRGVYVAEPAGMFRLDGPDNGWIIASVDSQLTPTLDDFIRVMQGIPDRERVPVVYYSIADVHMTSMAVVQVDRHWSRFRLAVRNDKTGVWDFTDLNAAAPPPKPLQPATAKFVELDESLGSAKQLISSLVKVTYYMPIKLDGFPRSRKQGAGLVVDAERGLIVVGRNIVPFALGDLSITFADSIVIPGKVEFLHPTHNVAMVSYDPRLLGETPVQSAQLSDTPLVQGHKVTLLAFNHNYRPVCLTTVVTDITCVTIPQNATPRFRGINLDAITLDTPLAQQCSSGVLADHEGRVQGLWLSYLGERTVNGHDNEYHLGLHIHTIRPILEPLRLGARPQLRLLSVELVPVQMVQARHMGVSDDWVRQVEAANPQRHQLFMIRRVETASVASEWLRDLDLILAVNGNVLTRMIELEAHVTHESLSLTILREKKELTVQVPTTPIDGEDVRRVLSWAGAIIQEPHKAVLQQSKKLPSRVYISARSRGSPAYMYGMVPTMWITHVNGRATPDVDTFLAVVRDRPDNTYVRVKIITFDMIPMVLSIKQNLHYWPTTLLERDDDADCGWRFTAITKSC
ncbi:trypsin-like cysteine/serine peptidase domain-containing protein [Syncephalis pseudoplumigaleata]|uniref:Trypsin-like cysteine/serine peptidase domain-containing protein n=1 Tax=Syncephalis pseudoplumigaleata TaxID=1712513 RepID=A0A4P9Z2J7_9FUNG|nr:trypsin-like cysteine/serine peptidase domain-containing protein [Syncephalis pseudoplumigaleata]|eukprot:RKP25690.1 trypsin-like cysteine/serine peptidase domain-containing protein [Syncephalis pseudoplumigaleata]